MIRMASVHDPVDEKNGPRFLIDWKWPERKHHHDLKLTGWPRDLLPEESLWNWFHHEPVGRREAFQRRYQRQLSALIKVWQPIVEASRNGIVTLLHDAKKARLTPAQFLKDFLEHKASSIRLKPVRRRLGIKIEGRGVAPPVEKAISRKKSRPLMAKASGGKVRKMTLMQSGKRRTA